ncbi:MAG: BCCT family transporter, partial [Rubrobacter sp.]|nr:BCCT family transporter [Rubrobacter sp.]
GSLVIDILTNGGDPNPIWLQRLFWALIEGVVASVLLAIGGLSALQTASLIAGLPFAIVLLVVAYGLVKGLSEERLPSVTPEPGRDTTPPDPGRRATSRPSTSTAPQQVQQMSSESPTEGTNRSS